MTICYPMLSPRSMDQGLSFLGHAPSSTAPICVWEPKEGTQFSGRKEYIARLFVYASARKMRFIITKDTGATLEHTCQSCRIGKITLRIKRTRNGNGALVAGQATIARVLLCACTIKERRNVSSLISYMGLKYSSRLEFTEIGKAYFSGRCHSRRDSGNRIDYRCLVCRTGYFSAVLSPGISKVTGRQTWTVPLTVASADNCTPACARDGALQVPSETPIEMESNLTLAKVEEADVRAEARLIAQVDKADVREEARLVPDPQECITIQGECEPLDFICQSVAEQSSLDGRYEVLKLNGLTDRADANNFLKKNNLFLDQKLEPCNEPVSRDNTITTKRHRVSHSRKQTKMQNFFKLRK